MKKLTKRELESIKGALWGFLMLLLGCLYLPFSDGDLTASLLTWIIGIFIAYLEIRYFFYLRSKRRIRNRKALA